MQAKPGTYALIYQSQSRVNIKVGRWGYIKLQPGYYVYVGSAFGPGGVRARVLRHWRESMSKHWHIDYIQKQLMPVCAWHCYGTRDIEHEWANLFLKLDGAEAVEGFGCSDCRCFSHLFSTIEKPCLTNFCTILGEQIESSKYVATA